MRRTSKWLTISCDLCYGCPENTQIFCFTGSLIFINTIELLAIDHYNESTMCSASVKVQRLHKREQKHITETLALTLILETMNID